MTSSMLFPTFPRPYFLDANVLISAWRDYYPPDLHPGFWEYVEHSFREGQLRSVDRVYEELITPEDLIAWANKLSERFFAFSGEEDVIKTYRMMQEWVQTNAQFLPVARYDFAGAADGWLAAYAKVYNGIVVTNEVRDSHSRKRVPLPNLCCEFEIPVTNTLGMLRGLGARFEFRHID